MRKDYIAPIRKVWPPGSEGPSALDRSWNIVSGPSDAAGHALPQSVARQTLMACGPSRSDSVACMRAHHIYNLAIYQPPSRFWLLQGIEAAIFTGLAIALLGFTVWWVRHRVS